MIAVGCYGNSNRASDSEIWIEYLCKEKRCISAEEKERGMYEFKIWSCEARE